MLTLRHSLALVIAQPQLCATSPPHLIRRTWNAGTHLDSATRSFVDSALRRSGNWLQLSAFQTQTCHWQVPIGHPPLSIGQRAARPSGSSQPSVCSSPSESARAWGTRSGRFRFLCHGQAFTRLVATWPFAWDGRGAKCPPKSASASKRNGEGTRRSRGPAGRKDGHSAKGERGGCPKSFAPSYSWLRA